MWIIFKHVGENNKRHLLFNILTVYRDKNDPDRKWVFRFLQPIYHYHT